MSALRRICVFCGSSRGVRPEYAAVAAELARELARRRIGIVYGGGNVGLMGVLADAALAAKGEVIGVIPYGLSVREVAHAHVTELRVVSSMHERKAIMADLSDAFVALPGGYGTFEELLEVVTWSQLGMHEKPVAVLDVRGFYAPLFELVARASDEGFVRRENRELLLRAESVAGLLDELERFVPAPRERWIDRAST